MATITFTTRATNKTVSLPSEEAIERLFADASAWFGWPFALTAGCAIVSAVFALIAGRKD